MYRYIDVMAYAMPTIVVYRKARYNTITMHTDGRKQLVVLRCVCMFPERIITPSLSYTTNRLRIGAFVVNAIAIVE